MQNGLYQRKHASTARQAEALAMRIRGTTFKAIGEKLGVTRARAYQLVQRKDVSRNLRNATLGIELRPGLELDWLYAA